MKKPDLSGKPVAKIFPKWLKDVEKGNCPSCGAMIEHVKFRDALSIKEYYISGLCQECQDSVFGKGG